MCEHAFVACGDGGIRRRECAWTDSSTGIAVTIDPISGNPHIIESASNTDVGGPFSGGGVTLVAGRGRWFVLGDASCHVFQPGGFRWQDRRQSPILGEIIVEVDQHPLNPLTFELGASTAIGRHSETLLEVGPNFDDASLMVFSTAYRI